jgi:hypothetical protein
MRGFPMCITVVWNVGVQSGVQRCQSEQSNATYSVYHGVKTHFDDDARVWHVTCGSQTNVIVW